MLFYVVQRMKLEKVRSPTKQEVTNCHPYLARIIELVNPKVIVTLGKKALEALKEIETHQLLLKEDVGTYTKWNNRWLYPLYHPSPQVINTKKSGQCHNKELISDS
ncbi:hypothetical protein GCM10020331_073820 [Ectobacillus funiculus]